MTESRTATFYTIGGKEMRVLIDLLEQAVKNGTLTDAQMEALANDPMDIVTDMQKLEILDGKIRVLDKGFNAAHGK